MTGELVHIYDEHSEQVNCCHFTNNSHYLLLATASSDCFLKVSVDNENCVNKFDRCIRTSFSIFSCINQGSFGCSDRNFHTSLSQKKKKLLVHVTERSRGSMALGITDSRCLNYILGA